jgi:hypothetical protein
MSVKLGRHVLLWWAFRRERAWFKYEINVADLIGLYLRNILVGNRHLVYPFGGGGPGGGRLWDERHGHSARVGTGFPVLVTIKSVFILLRLTVIKFRRKLSRTVFMSCQQNAGQNHNIILIAEKCFENVTNRNSFIRRLTNRNYIHEAVTSRLYSGNSCYHAFHNP